MVERYSFVAISTTDLGRARRFWVEQMAFPVTEEVADHHFIVDAAKRSRNAVCAQKNGRAPGAPMPSCMIRMGGSSSSPRLIE